MIKVTENAIIIDRKALSDWLNKEGDVPWDGDPNSTSDLTDAEKKELDKEVHGYVTGSGEKKPFPNPAKGDEHVQDEDIGERPDSVNLFDVGPNGIGGTLQDAPKGADKIKDMRDWLKKQKFNYRNFCLFLHGITELGGWPLSEPLIGTTAKGEPSLFQVAARFHSYWMSSKDEVAKAYKKFLHGQLEDMGVKIELITDMFNGTEIDPKKLPKGIEVS